MSSQGREQNSSRSNYAPANTIVHGLLTLMS